MYSSSGFAGGVFLLFLSSKFDVKGKLKSGGRPSSKEKHENGGLGNKLSYIEFS
jgi:hypothetical protein